MPSSKPTPEDTQGQRSPITNDGVVAANKALGLSDETVHLDPGRGRAARTARGQRIWEDRSEPPPGCIPHRTEAGWVEHAWDAATLAVAWREYDSLRDRIRAEARAEWEAERAKLIEDTRAELRQELFEGVVREVLDRDPANIDQLRAEARASAFLEMAYHARNPDHECEWTAEKEWAAKMFVESWARARAEGRAEGAREKEREIIARIDVPGALCNEPGFVIAQVLRTDAIRRDDTGRHTTEGSDDQ